VRGCASLFADEVDRIQSGHSAGHAIKMLIQSCAHTFVAKFEANGFENLPAVREWFNQQLDRNRWIVATADTLVRA